MERVAPAALAALRRPPLPEKESPQAVPCAKCSAPVEPGDAFCPACGAPQQHPTAGASAAQAIAAAAKAGRDGEPTAPGTAFRCDKCGAEVRFDPESRTTSCPFCAAPYVVEIDPKATGRQDPEFVIGFAITPDRAEVVYRAWLGSRGLFRPSDLHQAAQAEQLRGIYLPFWSFSMRADSRWAARIGEHWYRTETYTERDPNGNFVQKERQVQETEWWPLEGGHHAYYSFYLVSGSKGLPQNVSQWIEPFQLLALKRYAPAYLAGWLSEEYSVAQEKALAASEQEFRNRERSAIAAFLPGDTHNGLQVETEFSKVNSDLILLPIYLRSYRYRGKLYRTLINGQTGKISGEKPVSIGRVFLFILLLAALGGLIALLATLVGGMGR